MSKYKMFNIAIGTTKSNVVNGKEEGAKKYIACTVVNQDCFFEPASNIIMFDVDYLVQQVEPFLDAEHGGTAATNNEAGIPQQYTTIHNGIFVSQPLERGKSFMTDASGNVRVDKYGQTIVIDKITVFCIVLQQLGDQIVYAKGWDPVSRVRAVERQYFRPVVAQTTAAPELKPVEDPLNVGTQQPTQQQPPVQQPTQQQQAPTPGAPGALGATF